MVKLKVPLFHAGRMLEAGQSIGLPSELEQALVEAGNAEQLLSIDPPPMEEPGQANQEHDDPAKDNQEEPAQVDPGSDESAGNAIAEQLPLGRGLK